MLFRSVDQCYTSCNNYLSNVFVIINIIIIIIVIINIVIIYIS